jgi:hypothetical protein
VFRVFGSKDKAISSRRIIHLFFSRNSGGGHTFDKIEEKIAKVHGASLRFSDEQLLQWYSYSSNYGTYQLIIDDPICATSTLVGLVESFGSSSWKVKTRRTTEAAFLSMSSSP